MRSVHPARFSVLGTVTISLALILSGCGATGGGGNGDPSKDDVVAALNKELEADPELKGAFPKDKRETYAECAADIVLKRGNKDDVKAWLDGKKKSEDIRGIDGDQTKDADFEACGKKLQ